MKRGALALFPWLLAVAMKGSKVVDWGSTILDLGIGIRTYKHIHHKSQKKLRRLVRQRGSK